MKNSLILNYPLEKKSTRIIVEEGLFNDPSWVNLLNFLPSRFAIIYDKKVEKLAHLVSKDLKAKNFETHLFSVIAEEHNKTRERKSALEDEMQKAGLSRDTTVIAIGGGMVTDLAGFLASTYARGVPLILVPTTLLGMVDAAIGGKTGVNTVFGKNLIGSFFAPHAILMDVKTLQSLPQNEILNGLSEVIKYGLIASDSLFERLQNHELSFQELILDSISIKKEVIELDPQEKGLRRILNFGHTIGHALEMSSQHQLSHGQAIAIGMQAEAYLSYCLGFLKAEDLEAIHALFKLYHFPECPSTITSTQILKYFELDKKSVGGIPRFVILSKIGKTVPFEGNYCTQVEPQLLYETLQWMLAHAS